VISLVLCLRSQIFLGCALSDFLSPDARLVLISLTQRVVPTSVASPGFLGCAFEFLRWSASLTPVGGAARRDSPLRICIVADFSSLQQFLLSTALDPWCSRFVFTAREFHFAARTSSAGSHSVSIRFLLLCMEFLTASPLVSTPTLFSTRGAGAHLVSLCS
jgi:hypothetical protein